MDKDTTQLRYRLSIPGCRFEWYAAVNGGRQFPENNQTTRSAVKVKSRVKVYPESFASFPLERIPPTLFIVDAQNAVKRYVHIVEVQHYSGIRKKSKWMTERKKITINHINNNRFLYAQENGTSPRITFLSFS